MLFGFWLFIVCSGISNFFYPDVAIIVVENDVKSVCFIENNLIITVVFFSGGPQESNLLKNLIFVLNCFHKMMNH